MRPLPLASLFLLLLAAVPAAAVPISDEPRNKQMDRGQFTIRLRDKVIGAETFGIEARADSVNCQARSYRTQTTEQGNEEIQKLVGVSFGRLDWALRFYQSEETFRGETIVRGVVYDANDTALTVYKEQRGGRGLANRLPSPPGRLFILDSGLYTLFDLMCFYLHDKTFDSRPLNILTFGEPDTVIEVKVNDLGHETIRWASRPVSARKLQFVQGPMTLETWLEPGTGRMLRLQHAATGLVVERVAPAVKKRATPAPKPAG